MGADTAYVRLSATRVEPAAAVRGAARWEGLMGVKWGGRAPTGTDEDGLKVPPASHLL